MKMHLVYETKSTGLHYTRVVCRTEETTTARWAAHMSAVRKAIHCCRQQLPPETFLNQADDGGYQCIHANYQ